MFVGYGMRMKTQDGFWSYFWAIATGVCSALTFQHVLFVLGFIVTGTFTWLTFRSNDRKNKAIIEESRHRVEEERKRTEILRLSVANGTPPSASQAMTILGKVESSAEPEEVNDGDADISAQ